MNTRTFEEQTENIRRVCKEIQAFNVDSVYHDRVSDFLDQYWGSMCVLPMTAQLVGGRVGVRWNLNDTGYVSVLFGPGDEWEWTVNATSNALGHTTNMHYAGKGHHYRVLNTDHIHYCLPEEVDTFIKLDDPFHQPTTISKGECRIAWVTDRYDGALSGFCIYQRKLHYFDMVEETDFERNRLYGVYKLTRWQRMWFYIDHESRYIPGVRFLRKVADNQRYEHMRWLWSDQDRAVYYRDKRAEKEALIAQRCVGYFSF